MNLGDVAVAVNGEIRQFPRLSVRQLCSMAAVLGERNALETAQDCQRLNLSPEDALARCRQAREDARLSTAVVRWCFTMDGALRVLSESVGADRVDALADGMSPDMLTETALQVVGFEWSDELGKWVRRSTLAPSNGRATG